LVLCDTECTFGEGSANIVRASHICDAVIVLSAIISVLSPLANTPKANTSAAQGDGIRSARAASFTWIGICDASQGSSGTFAVSSADAFPVLADRGARLSKSKPIGAHSRLVAI